RELFPLPRAAGCVRHEIGTCLGPCAAACTHAAYAEQVRAARAFLEGADTALLETVERTMAEAAAALAFGRAAPLRAKRDAVRWRHDHLTRRRGARERYTFIYPVRGQGGELWYLIRQGRVLAAVPSPEEETSRQAAAAQIEAVYRQQGRVQPP